MAVQITQENIVTVILVILVLGFFSLERVVNALVAVVAESMKASALDWEAQDKHARIAAAGIVLRHLSIVLKVLSCLALALGYWKAFGEVARLTLPEHSLGFAIVISYCGLVVILSLLAPELWNAAKKLMAFGTAIGKAGAAGTAVAGAPPATGITP